MLLRAGVGGRESGASPPAICELATTFCAVDPTPESRLPTPAQVAANWLGYDTYRLMDDAPNFGSIEGSRLM